VTSKPLQSVYNFARREAEITRKKKANNLQRQREIKKNTKNKNMIKDRNHKIMKQRKKQKNK
jgi:hypothetical protein